jgi:hypothetical protein
MEIPHMENDGAKNEILHDELSNMHGNFLPVWFFLDPLGEIPKFLVPAGAEDMHELEYF